MIDIKVNSKLALLIIGLGAFVSAILIVRESSRDPASPNYNEALVMGKRSPAPESIPPSPEITAPVSNPSINTQNPTAPPPVPSQYPWHRGITATVFWVGEPQGGGSSEDNAFSAWDDEWQKNYGGYDDPVNRKGYYPADFTPKQNPFYLDLPYNDFTDSGDRKSGAFHVIPWAGQKKWGQLESMMKNRWVKLKKGSVTCFGQIEDAGPYEYDDANYVFGESQPKNKLANNAGLDVSPAIRDCLKFVGINNDENQVDWQFVDEKDVTPGPWKQIITTSQINWP